MGSLADWEAAGKLQDLRMKRDCWIPLLQRMCRDSCVGHLRHTCLLLQSASMTSQQMGCS